MKRIIGILTIVLVLLSLAGCAPTENIQQDMLIAEETISDQQVRIDELSSELDRASEALETERGRSAELEETQTTLANTQRALTDAQTVTQDTKAQLADAQEQLRAISETPFGLYYIMDTPIGPQLESLPDSETLIDGSILIDGYVLIRSHDDVKSRYGVRDTTLGNWLLVGTSAKDVEVDRDVLSGLITGLNISKTVAVGYQEIVEKWGGTHTPNRYGSLVWVYIPCTWKSGLGWVSDYPIRVLKHPLVEYHVNDFYGHAVSPQFEILEKTKQVMTLALDPELIVQARESAVEAGIDFEEWLTEAILTKIK